MLSGGCFRAERRCTSRAGRTQSRGCARHDECVRSESPKTLIALCVSPGYFDLVPDHLPVAVVGMASLFPEAGSLREYWENIVRGKDCIRHVPPGHWREEDSF